MPKFDEQNVMLNNAIIVWNGITQPSKNDDGSLTYELGIVCEPNNPDLPLVEEIANAELQGGQFRGVLPSGANWPTKQLGPQDLDGLFPGFVKITVKSKFLPKIYDEQGNEMSPMQYGPLMYTGQRVEVMMNAYSYNNKQKGVACGLQGFRILASLQAPQVQIGGGGVDVSSAFGAPQQGQQPNYGHAPQQGQQPNYGHAPQQGAPQQGQQPNYGAPQQGAPAQHGQQPNYGAPQQGAPAQHGAPQQSTDYLPHQ